jgi:peptidoglycan/LPS O-acetylase OafA/YrhL
MVGTGWLGVDVFFVLSGFLITGILLDTRDRPDYWPQFLWRRVLRILPIYVPFAVFAMAVHAASRAEGVSVAPAWTFPVFLQNWWFGPGWFDARPETTLPSWSLAVEEQFYLVWPWLVRARGPRRLGWLCIAIVAASPAIRAPIALALGPNAAYMWTICRLDALAIGALVAIAARTPGTPGLAALARAAPWAWVLVAAGSAVDLWHRDTPFGFTFGYTFIAGSAAALIAAGLRGGTVATWLSNPILRRFGEISYGLYLVHAIALRGLTRVWREILGREPGGTTGDALAYAVVGICLATGLAAASYRLWEVRWLRLKDRDRRLQWSQPAR